MNRQYVTSSDIRSIGYDSSTQILEIEFNSGGTYQYFNVPYSVYAALMNAGSHGEFFHAYIKDRYAYRKIA